eukprot:gene11287-13336_t
MTTPTGLKFHATFPENATNAEVYKESVEFRCLQIRNDNIEDVLHRQRNALHLTSNPHQGKSIRDASVLTIDDFTSKKIQEVFKALHDAVFQHSVDQLGVAIVLESITEKDENYLTAAKPMDVAAGRRGHLLLTVTFEREDLKLRNATLNLVELARLELEGSRRDPRRVRDSQAGSAREACKSRTVCAAYRESKLTRLLEPSFRALANGEGQFSFICTLHRRQMQEVKHSLNLASELY